ncbi:hypothetical protein KZZ52_19055 [Dactylosporangium sp. AC04546]|uniref:hypothetical protein n=1 Tax=Dactylosporangium sp. AC04546 TaxID=2862460 RepID=UPI001EE0EC50|nr:hypothetical protein [Dactylosporangium sp. AC04546]WVK87401.1 hypothetical protein KZZ52_19055 [Dactylosporangium sp. AC04546]
MTRLAETLDEIADQAKVYDVTDRSLRGARRRRRLRFVMKTAFSVTAAVCVIGVVAALVRPLTFGGGPGTPEGGPGRLDGEPAALVRPLLDTPARGSLAGDKAYLEDVLGRIAGDPERYGLPGDRARLRVLFAGDVPGKRRLVIVAGITARPRTIELTGSRGASAQRLDLTGWLDLEEPIVRSEWLGDRTGTGYALVFGPAGYDVWVSERPRYLADGTVGRDWRPEPAGYVLRDVAGMPAGLRVRMSRGDDVLYEGQVASAGTKRTGTVDPAPLYGRGRPAPRAAESAADALAYRLGLTGPDVHYVVLWSDAFEVEEPNGIGTGMGQIATVMAVTADGGGPYITIATDASPQPNTRNHPTGAGVAGDPAKALIAMRLPHFTAEASDALQIVGPPAAKRAEIRQGDTVVMTTPLDNGVGRVELPGPADVTVRAYDEHGVVIAERAFADVVAGAAPADPFEPELKGWK